MNHRRPPLKEKEEDGEVERDSNSSSVEMKRLQDIVKQRDEELS